MTDSKTTAVYGTAERDARQARNRRRGKRIASAAYTTITIIVLAIVLFPLLWTLTSVFKGKTELFDVPNTIFPKEFTLANFEKIFTLRQYDFFQSMISTFAVSLAALVVSLLVNPLAAYAFSRLEFPGREVLFQIVLFTMFIPGVTILLSSIKVVEALGMLDTFWVLVLPGAASGYAVFFFRQFFLAMPESIEEAALIDGANHWLIYLRIFLPMSLTPIIIIGTGTFIGYWNSYLWPTLTIIDRDGLKQVMQVIRVLSSSYQGEYGIVVAASLLSLALPLTMFAIFQKKIVAGISITGLK